MCTTRHFRSKGQCATESQLLNTSHDRRCCRGRLAMTPLSDSGAVRLTRSASRKKLSHARSRPKVGATVILAVKITW